MVGDMEKETVAMGRQAGNDGCVQMECGRKPMATFDSHKSAKKQSASETKEKMGAREYRLPRPRVPRIIN